MLQHIVWYLSMVPMAVQVSTTNTIGSGLNREEKGGVDSWKIPLEFEVQLLHFPGLGQQKLEPKSAQRAPVKQWILDREQEFQQKKKIGQEVWTWMICFGFLIHFPFYIDPLLKFPPRLLARSSP